MEFGEGLKFASRESFWKVTHCQGGREERDNAGERKGEEGEEEKGREIKQVHRRGEREREGKRGTRNKKAFGMW